VYYFTKKGEKVRAVDEVSLKINRNESLALIGESGCGKSTLACSILRLLPLNAKVIKGQIIFQGKIDLIKAKENILRQIRFKKISMIFQGAMNMLNPVMKIEDQIAEVITLHENVAKKEAIQEAKKLLEMVGIPSHRGKDYPHQLSGGQKQRVCIAMAVALKPDLIIADEPFTALDVMIQAQLIELLNKIRKLTGSSLIFITHDIHVVRELCEKIAVMYAGKIVEYGDLNSVVKSPLHPYTEALLRAIPTIDGPIIKPRSIHGSPPSLANPPPGCRFHPRCPYRFDHCYKRMPQLIRVEKEHYAACHLLAGGRNYAKQRTPNSSS